MADFIYLIETRLGAVARREGFEGVPELIEAIRVDRDERIIWETVEAMAAALGLSCATWRRVRA